MKQRRYMMKSGQRKLQGASGRGYRNRLGTLHNKMKARESSPELNLPYDLTYNDAFRAGFARGYEDGYIS